VASSSTPRRLQEPADSSTLTWRCASAAHHLHPVVERHVLLRRVGVGAQRQRRAAVDLHAGDLEAARIEVAHGVGHDDAGRELERLGHVGRTLVVELLARHHRHRLGNLAERLVRLRRDAGHAAGICARAFGRAIARAAGQHAHLGQGLAAGGRGRLHGQRAVTHLAVEAAACEQRIQRLAQRQRAAHGGRLALGRQVGLEHQLQPRLPRELVQRAGQRLRGDVEAHGLRRRLGQGGVQRQGQAQAQCGPGQRGAAETEEKRRHGIRP
jgi:hypothetical protein